MQLLPPISEQIPAGPLPSRAVPGAASHHLLVNELINGTRKGKHPQAGLWFLMCHLGSCGRKVLVTLVTLRKNELELRGKPKNKACVC